MIHDTYVGHHQRGEIRGAYVCESLAKERSQLSDFFPFLAMVSEEAVGDVGDDDVGLVCWSGLSAAKRIDLQSLFHSLGWQAVTLTINFDY